MKLSSLFLENDPDQGPNYSITRLISQCFDQCKGIPKKISLDTEVEDDDDDQLVYSGEIVHSRELFAARGRIFADAEGILDAVDNEKVRLLIGAYSNDWEEFFVAEDDNELLVKKFGDNIRIEYKNEKYIFTESQFRLFYDEFTDKYLGKYERMKSKTRIRRVGWPKGPFEDDNYDITYHDLDLHCGFCFKDYGHN